MENSEAYYKILKLRNSDTKNLDLLLPLLRKRGSLMQAQQAQKALLNKQSKQVSQLLKSSEKEALIKTMKNLKKELLVNQNEVDSLLKETNQLLLTLPNLLDSNVPYGESEEDNQIVFTKNPNQRKLVESNLSHLDISHELNFLDMSRATKMSGSRFALYKNDGAQLMRALKNFYLDENIKSGYQEVSLPIIVNPQALINSAQLPKFADDLFRLTNGQYLIPTSEVSLINIHAQEILKKEKIRYTAFSNCYRSESAASGKDRKGVMRLHQFQKVELVSICHPHLGSEEFLAMQKQVEKIIELLEIPYRKILLCSADTSFASAITYDYELWIPSEKKYREVSSVSWVLNFQAMRAMIRYKDENNKVFAHTLNGSGLSLDRVFVAIIENNYDPKTKTVKVPKALVPYLNKTSIGSI